MPELKPAVTNGRGNYTNLWTLVQVVGNVSGLISLLTVAVFFGGLKKQVDINTIRLDKIEAGGSPTLQTTSKILEMEIATRREEDAITNKRLDENRADFLDRTEKMNRLVEAQIKQATELIALLKAQNQIKP